MKNTRKIFSYQLFKKKKYLSINIRPSYLNLHFFTKKKKKLVAKFSIPKPSVYRKKERSPNRISKGYE